MKTYGQIRKEILKICADYGVFITDTYRGHLLHYPENTPVEKLDELDDLLRQERETLT